MSDPLHNLDDTGLGGGYGGPVNDDRDTFGNVVILLLVAVPFVLGFALGVVMTIRLGWH